MIKVIAFDFDGVIADSENECYLISLPAFRQLGETIGDTKRIREQFRKARPYVKHADDYYTILTILQNPKADFDRISFSTFAAEMRKNAKRGKEFHRRFYEERGKLQRNMKQWISLNPPFEGMPKIIRKLMKEFTIVIVTAKDKKATQLLLKSYGLNINEENILPKEFSMDKKDHMKFISKKFGAHLDEIVFIEDNLGQLLNIKGLGVKMVMVDWGYSTKQQRDKAKSLGIKVVTKKKFEEVIKQTADEPTIGKTEEIFDVVDKDNKVIGKAPRSEVHARGLWHRATHVIILNSGGEMLLQKRSMTKDLYKGFWIDAAAGHLDAGETYESAARRELKEELGISTRLRKLFDFRKYTGNDNEFIRVFAGRHEGPFKVNKEEVDFVKFFSFGKIMEMLKTEKFTPASVQIFSELKAKPELLKRLRLS